MYRVFQSGKSENIDLTDNSLHVVISDALSEKDRVKFTVHTKVSFLDFALANVQITSGN